jgi:3-deoxy-D-manno-octulosonate 8-phosphate phosphatase (KDO 8-P phosphatase)
MQPLTFERQQIVKQLKLLILDVDGVLTDGRLFFDADNREYKFFHVRDGHGIKMLRSSGVEVAVISGGLSETVNYRMRRLGVELIYQGYENKRQAFQELIERLNIRAEQAAHIGDDVLDLPIMNRAGFAVAVRDAHEWVKQHAHYVTDASGGQGAVREVCDLIMRSQGTLDALLEEYR